MKLSKKNILVFRIITTFCLVFFILSEYFPPFKVIDGYPIKHIVVIAYVIYFGFNYIFYKKRTNYRSIENKYLLKNFSLLFIPIFILFLISLIKQFILGDLELYTLKEMYFLIIPILFVLVVYLYENNVESYMNILFLVSIICFISIFAPSGKLTIGNIMECFNLKKTLLESKTPIESNLGQYFFLCSFYFFSNKKNIRGLVSILFVILCSKRFSIVFSLLLIPFYIYINFKKHHNKKIIPSNLFVLFINILFVVSPLVIYNLYLHPNFATDFYNYTGLRLDNFVMARNTIFDLSMSKGGMFAGLGSVTNILESYNKSGMTNLHNDLMMIFMDCGFIGLLSFVYYYFKFSRYNLYSFFIMTFIMVQLLSAHYLGRGGLGFWIIGLLVMVSFNKINIESKNLFEGDFKHEQ